MIEFDLEVDATGLNCPLPLLRLKKSLLEVESEQIIKVIATDPAAHLDIGVYCEQIGHILESVIKETGRQIFYIRKK